MVLVNKMFLVGMLGMALACSSGGSENKGLSEEEEIIQLKGVALLSTSLQTTLGYEKDEDVSDPGESLLEKYKKVFGEIEGLSVGKTYADTASGTNVMTGYFLVLGHLAGNAATQCEISQDPSCNCDTAGSAREMLSRAIPYVDFSADYESEELVQEFAEMCLTNQREAIAALISSMAFAKRN